jgi:hypothetical protein
VQARRTQRYTTENPSLRISEENPVRISEGTENQWITANGTTDTRLRAASPAAAAAAGIRPPRRPSPPARATETIRVSVRVSIRVDLVNRLSIIDRDAGSRAGSDPITAWFAETDAGITVAVSALRTSPQRFESLGNSTAYLHRPESLYRRPVPVPDAIVK